MIVVLLNDMRASNVENIQPRFRALTQEAAEAYLQSQLANEPYKDGQWHKVYKSGSPLEWCNPPFSCAPTFQDVGTEDDWASNARASYQDQVMSLPEVP